MHIHRLIIKRQLILVGCLLGLSFIAVISWFILIWRPTIGAPGESDACHAANGCLLRNPTCDESTSDHDPSQSQILLSVFVLVNGFVDALAWYLLHKCTSQPKIKQEINIDSRNNRTDTALMREHDNTETENETEHEHDTDDMQSESKGEEEQNVSNALRGEIIAYMTAGLAKGIYNTSQETYERMYSYADMMDMSLNVRESMDGNGRL